MAVRESEQIADVTRRRTQEGRDEAIQLHQHDRPPRHRVATTASTRVYRKGGAGVGNREQQAEHEHQVEIVAVELLIDEQQVPGEEASRHTRNASVPARGEGAGGGEEEHREGQVEDSRQGRERDGVRDARGVGGKEPDSEPVPLLDGAEHERDPEHPTGEAERTGVGPGDEEVEQPVRQGHG